MNNFKQVLPGETADAFATRVSKETSLSKEMLRLAEASGAKDDIAAAKAHENDFLEMIGDSPWVDLRLAEVVKGTGNFAFISDEKVRKHLETAKQNFNIESSYLPAHMRQDLQ